MKILYTFILSAVLSIFASAQSKVQPGDSLQIAIKGVPQDEQSQITGVYVVNASGKLKLPLMNQLISASGSTTTVALRIESAYKNAGIYTTPTITVSSSRSQAEIDKDLEKLRTFVTVSGQVGRQGPIPYREGMTLNEVVSQASPNTFAALKRVVLLRNGKTYKYNLKDTTHMVLKVYPNDQITVDPVNWLNK